MEDHESRALLSSKDASNIPETLVDTSSTGDEWSGRSSNGVSYSSDSDSSIAEWESFVEPCGDLLYLRCNPHHPVSRPPVTDLTAEARSAFHRTSTRRSTRGTHHIHKNRYKSEGNRGKHSLGKLSKFIHRRDSKKYRNKSETKSQILAPLEPLAKVTFQECPEGELKTVKLKIDPTNKLKLGRRATISESLLGIQTTTFPDATRIMIAGFMPDVDAVQQRNIKIGDWLKKVNDVEVNSNNFNNILGDLTVKGEITILLQRVAGEEISSEPNEQSQFVRLLSNINNDDLRMISESLRSISVCVMCLTMEGLKEDSPDNDSIVYSYPSIDPGGKAIGVHTIKGAFLTLRHLLVDTLHAEPATTTVKFKDNVLNVTFTPSINEIMLVVIPNNYFNSIETEMLTIEIVRGLEFMYQSLTNCFLDSKNWVKLDQLFAVYFSQTLLDGGLTINNSTRNPVFEERLGATLWVPLPKEAQLRIDDALSELASADYRDWNDEPLTSRRKFLIIGSALFHGSALLGAQMPAGDLQDTNAFLSMLGLLQLAHLESIKDLVLWKEVYPKSVYRGLNFGVEMQEYRTPQGRWFILVVGQGKDLLSVIVESTVKSVGTVLPDPFYVEEAQATLEHLQTGGVCFLASQWIETSPRPQTVLSKNQESDGNTATRNKEIISILKRRNNGNEQVSSAHSNSLLNQPLTSSLIKSHPVSTQGGTTLLNQSYSSSNLSKDAEGSEDSGQRRDSDSDCDWEGLQGESQVGSGCDVSVLKQSLLTDVGGIIPSRLTAGVDNFLLHYVNLDSEGCVVVAPTKSVDHALMNTFRRACQAVHAVLQNTLRFRALLSQEIARPGAHRSLVAVREHGILVTSPGNVASPSQRFWVVGRLFSAPTREVFVCFQDGAPQNMVEIAFRLALSAAG